MTPSSPGSRFDVIIVGGGPAGLAAALVLGRCLRTVLLIDAGHPRNYASRAAHNYLTRDGIDPVEFLRTGRAEVAALGVEIRQGLVTAASCTEDGFEVVTAAARLKCRKLLLATGILDDLPRVENLEAFYGLGVHHCPYCDAFEYRGRPIAAYGAGKPAFGLAQNLLTWSDKVTAITDGHALDAEDLDLAHALGIPVRLEPVLRLEAAGVDQAGKPAFREPRQRVAVERVAPGEPDRLGRVVFASGLPLEVDALFFNTAQFQRSNLPFQLGCRKGEDGGVLTDDRQRTGIPGLYLAGDSSKDVQFIAVAAAEGATAGVAINGDLQAEFTERRRAVRPSDRPPPNPPPRSKG